MVSLISCPRLYQNRYFRLQFRKIEFCALPGMWQRNCFIPAWPLSLRQHRRSDVLCPAICERYNTLFQPRVYPDMILVWARAKTHTNTSNEISPSSLYPIFRKSRSLALTHLPSLSLCPTANSIAPNTSFIAPVRTRARDFAVPTRRYCGNSIGFMLISRNRYAISRIIRFTNFNPRQPKFPVENSRAQVSEGYRSSSCRWKRFFFTFNSNLPAEGKGRGQRKREIFNHQWSIV